MSSFSDIISVRETDFRKGCVKLVGSLHQEVRRTAGDKIESAAGILDLLEGIFVDVTEDR